VAALKWLVIGMGVLIVVGTVALSVALVQRLGGGGASGPAVAAALRQPEGTRIGGIAAAGGRLAVWVQRPDGERLLLLDPRTGRLAGEVRLGE
jgi:hypothetical protein